MTGEHHPDHTAQEALDRLKQGNERFVGGTARFPHPFATVLGCSDSRAPPELLFDASALRSRPTCAGPFGTCSKRAEDRARTAEGEMKLVGAVYDLATGRVRFLD